MKKNPKCWQSPTGSYPDLKSGRIWSSALNYRISYCFAAVTPCTDQKIFCLRGLTLLSFAPSKGMHKAELISNIRMVCIPAC